MKPPYRYLTLGPLVAFLGVMALAWRWPALESLIREHAKLLLVAACLWAVLVLVLQLRWLAKQRAPAKLSACHACGYELTGGTHEGCCPECGAAFRTP